MDQYPPTNNFPYQAQRTTEPHFFLSHAHVESDRANDLIAEPLRRRGLKVTIFRTNPALDPIMLTDRIRAALKPCTHVLVAVSRAAAGSGWVRGEVRESLENLPPERVIPVLFDEHINPTRIYPSLKTPPVDFIRSSTMGADALISRLQLQDYVISISATISNNSRNGRSADPSRMISPDGFPNACSYPFDPYGTTKYRPW